MGRLRRALSRLAEEHLDQVEFVLAIVLSLGIAVLAAFGTVSRTVLESAVLAALGLLLAATMRAGQRYKALAEQARATQRLNERVFEQLERVDQRFPLSFVAGHEQVVHLYQRLASGCQRSLVSYAIGVDLSDPYWRDHIVHYQAAIRTALERGVTQRRAQLLHPAPLTWLRYLLDLQRDHPDRSRFDLAFLEHDVAAGLSPMFQTLIADGQHMGIFSNLDAPGPEREFAIEITGHRSAGLLADHIVEVVMRSCRRYSDAALAEVIAGIERRRREDLRARVARRMLALADDGERYLPWEADFAAFRAAFPGTPDRYLYEEAHRASVALWSGDSGDAGSEGGGDPGGSGRPGGAGDRDAGDGSGRRRRIEAWRDAADPLGPHDAGTAPASLGP